MSGYEAMIEEVRFAEDSPLERTGFEPSVPRKAPDVGGASVPVRAEFFVGGESSRGHMSPVQLGSCHAVPTVRIRLPPAESRVRARPLWAGVWASRRFPTTRNAANRDRAVNRGAAPGDIVVCAAGGLPGELHKLWRCREPVAYHVEYGYSCMGYEIAGGLGVKLALPEHEVWVLVGDGSYLMMNSEIATSITLGKKGPATCVTRRQIDRVRIVVTPARGAERRAISFSDPRPSECPAAASLPRCMRLISFYRVHLIGQSGEREPKRIIS
jgi:hypothetical protein